MDDIEFLTNILNTSQFGSTQSILVTGIHGVGKTALIKHIQQIFKKEYLVVYLDLSSSDSYQEDKFDRYSFIINDAKIPRPLLGRG